jgi:uncharacterized membrane protein YhaH (DUF805 family)
MKVPRFLTRKLSSDFFDASVAQVLFFIVAGGTLFFGIQILLSLTLTTKEMHFGFLLLLVVFLLFMILGMLIPIAQYCTKRLKEGQTQD